MIADQQQIATRRLVVRRFRASDGAGLHAYLSRPEAVRFEPYDPVPRERCEQLAAERASDPDFWAVCLPSGVLVGNLYLHRHSPTDWGHYELGYVFHPDHWGNGYATEAASAIITACFADWGGHRVAAQCNPENTASWRLLERLGFRREGHLVRNVSFAADAAGDPVWQDTYCYAVLAEEWR